MKMRRTILAVIATLVVLTLSACGGSGGGNNTPTVTISPATANVQEGSTQQFSALVTNTSNTAVNWSVNGVAGGNATVGTISSTGLYTAPAVIPSPASVTITAALQGASNISSNAIATITTVVFNNSSLKGNYIFSLSGVDANGYSFNAVGAVTADGNGNITGGEEDLNDISSGPISTTSVTGTYVVNADGRGALNLNVPAISSSTFSYAIAMKALDNAVLNEIDNVVVAATGNLEQQTSTAVPAGNYAFGFSGVGLGCNAITSAGIFSLGSGNVGGTQDLNCGGSITQSQPLSGTYGNADGLGRGQGSFTASTGSSDFVYYVVSTSRYRFLCPDGATLFLGSADLQTQSSFASTDFNGSYVINTSANTSSGVAYTLMYINASGGNVSTGYYDTNNTGTVGQASLSGAYSVGSNGRVSGTFNVNNVGLPFAMYMISPSQAYYLDERTTGVGGGSVYAQSSSVTSNAGWAGSDATKQFGYFLVSGALNAFNASGVSGQLSADGNGNLAGTLDLNDPSGIFPGQTLQGTYSVGTTAPGRMTVAITTQAEGTRNYVGYIVGPNQVLLLETDTNLVSAGDSIRQF